jgi:metal-responsive CopG/Arc/MetJ family transcriptional regulator
MAIKREDTKAITVKFPLSLIEEIDQICSANYTSRTSWIINAARYLINQERNTKTNTLISKLAEREKDNEK